MHGRGQGVRHRSARPDLLPGVIVHHLVEADPLIACRGGQGKGLHAERCLLLERGLPRIDVLLPARRLAAIERHGVRLGKPHRLVQLVASLDVFEDLVDAIDIVRLRYRFTATASW
jgi:hypothetical protein